MLPAPVTVQESVVSYEIGNGVFLKYDLVAVSLIVDVNFDIHKRRMIHELMTQWPCPGIVATSIATSPYRIYSWRVMSAEKDPMMYIVNSTPPEREASNDFL